MPDFQPKHSIVRYETVRNDSRDSKFQCFRSDGLRAFDEYQSTGLHVTQIDADDWLAELEKGNDAPLPACRVSQGCR
jgi:hypothetical protein